MDLELTSAQRERRDLLLELRAANYARLRAVHVRLRAARSGGATQGKGFDRIEERAIGKPSGHTGSSVARAVLGRV